MNKILILALVLVVGFGAIFALSRRLEAVKPPPDAARGDDDLYFSADELAAAGHDARGLLADWYWINSLQYIGGKVLAEENVNINDLRPLNPRLLYPMLDAATTLDPRFVAAYAYGASVLPAIDHAQAVKLLEKGVAANPDEWRLYSDLGYIQWRLKNYARAAEIYGAGAEKAGAPGWMRQMSVRMKTEGASRDFARVVYRQMSETAADEQTRAFAELRYLQVESLDELDAINAALTDFKNQNNRCPNDLRAILPFYQKSKLPNKKNLRTGESGKIVDPTGVPYRLDDASCQAQVDGGISKIPVN